MGAEASAQVEQQIGIFGSERIVYDTRRLPAPAARWFDPDYLRAHACLQPEAEGRGCAWRFRAPGGEHVLRHYRRGGLLAAALGDLYCSMPLRDTRPAREVEMLRALRALGLPVPEPIAFRVCSLAPFYRADLITARIPQTQSLQARLSRAPLGAAGWRTLGAALRKFHELQVWHADLSLGNILVAPGPAFHLIDFDRARIRRGSWWKRRNLLRLQRSCMKRKRLQPELFFCAEDFAALLEGYQGTTP